MQQLRTFQGNREMVKIIAATRDWYREIGKEVGNELILPLHYLFVAGDEAELRSFTHYLDQVKSWGYGEDGSILSDGELRQMFPFIDRDVAGALLYPDAAQVDFEAAITHITKNATNATFALNTAMSQVVIKKDRVVKVATDRGEILTDKVVLATGPFSIGLRDRIIGGDFEVGDKLASLIEVRKPQRFTASVDGLSPDTRIFIIAPDGQAVRLCTGPDGSGHGDYVFADPKGELVTSPVLNPKADESDFPAIVYAGLGSIISHYGDERHSGSLARIPIHSSRIAGYYAETRDDLPIVCETDVEGLYLNVAHSHVGVMDRGAASQMADIICNGEASNNPFSINRSFDEGEGIRI
jgi:glycine/D-amino acid oxidase-like deaminating enzyme